MATILWLETKIWEILESHFANEQRMLAYKNYSTLPVFENVMAEMFTGPVQICVFLYCFTMFETDVQTLTRKLRRKKEY